MSAERVTTKAIIETIKTFINMPIFFFISTDSVSPASFLIYERLSVKAAAKLLFSRIKI